MNGHEIVVLPLAVKLHVVIVELVDLLVNGLLRKRITVLEWQNVLLDLVLDANHVVKVAAVCIFAIIWIVDDI